MKTSNLCQQCGSTFQVQSYTLPAFVAILMVFFMYPAVVFTGTLALEFCYEVLGVLGRVKSHSPLLLTLSFVATVKLCTTLWSPVFGRLNEICHYCRAEGDDCEISARDIIQLGTVILTFYAGLFCFFSSF